MSVRESDSIGKQLGQPFIASTPSFDYASLDLDNRAMVQQCTSEIKSLTKRTTGDTIRIGEILMMVKNRLKHGQFGRWLEVEFDWSDFTARQFMNAAKAFKSENFSDLNIATSALYRLASPSTPESARQEALKRAFQGETITSSKAQKIVDRYKNPPILPEVLPPEQEIISAQEVVTPPSITITIPAIAAPFRKPSVEEKALVEAGVELDPQKRPDVKEKYYGQPDQEIAGDAEIWSNDYTQAVTRLQPEPPIQVLSIDVEASKLQENILQVFEVISPGVRIQFQSHLGTAISLFQQLQEFPTLAHKYVA